MSSLKRETIIYSGSDILRRITGIIMLPIYTQYLTPADYGVVELLTMVIGLGQIFFGVRSSEAVFRYCMSESESIRNRIIFIGLVITTATISIGALFALIFSGQISDFLIGNREHLLDVKIFAVLVLLTSVEEYAFSILRLMKKAKLFFVINVFRLFLQVSFNVLFIVILDMHVRGVSLSALIAISLTCLILITYILNKVGFHKIDLPWAKKIAGYSIPLLAASFVGFAIGSLDSIFIRFNYGLETVGIYALSKKIAFILALVIWQPFSRSWQGYKYQIHENSEHEKYREVFIQLFFFTLLVGFLLSIFAADIVEVMTDRKFWDAQLYIPILAIASMLTIGRQFLNFGILLHGNTVLIAKIRLAILVLVLIGYALSIPQFGPWGAATTYCLVMLVETVVINHFAIKYYNMEINWSTIIAGFFSVAAVFFAWKFLSAADVLEPIPLRILAIVIVLLICVFAIKSEINACKVAAKARGEVDGIE